MSIQNTPTGFIACCKDCGWAEYHGRKEDAQGKDRRHQTRCPANLTDVQAVGWKTAQRTNLEEIR